MNRNVNKRRSVAIIGSGPAGLVVAQKFNLKSDHFDVTIFEKLNGVGGSWIYSDETGIDKYGLPVHSSVYSNLKTNLPTVLMEFDDYPHNHNPSGFITHQEVLQYLQRFSNHFNLQKYTKFLHLVTKVSRDLNCWLIDYRNLETSETFTQLFDIVCVCHGRFSYPSLPDILGLHTFKGTVTHAHDYRHPDVFKGQRVAILGGGPSGIDIAVEVSEFADKTYLCYVPKEKGITHQLGNKIIQPRAIFKSIAIDSIELTNGTVLQSIDTIIFATGYRIDLDFIDSSCGIKGEEGRVDGLFMHMININHPTMAFFGLIEKIPPFNFYCQMAKYFIGTLTGESYLPSKDEMILDLQADRKKRQLMNIKPKYSHRMFNDQLWQYDEKISQLGGFNCLLPLIKSIYEACTELRFRKVNYKDYQFLIDYDCSTFTIIPKDEETTDEQLI